ncbi:MAG: hypothetical protein WAT91_18845 [Saprospiraceae bacterium]
MKSRLPSIIIILLATILGMYGLSLINVHSSWYDIGLWFQYASKYLLYFLPILFLVSLVKQLTKFATWILILILSFSLAYGFIYVGVHNMLSNFQLTITILYVSAISALVVSIYKNFEIFTKKTQSNQR